MRFVLRVHQPLVVVVLPGIALLQFVAGLLERALALPDRILLKLKGALKHDSDTTRSRSVSLMPAHLIPEHNESAVDGAEHKKSSFSLLLKKCYF